MLETLEAAGVSAFLLRPPQMATAPNLPAMRETRARLGALRAAIGGPMSGVAEARAGVSRLIGGLSAQALDADAAAKAAALSSRAAEWVRGQAQARAQRVRAAWLGLSTLLSQGSLDQAALAAAMSPAGEGPMRAQEKSRSALAHRETFRGRLCWRIHLDADGRVERAEVSAPVDRAVREGRTIARLVEDAPRSCRRELAQLLACVLDPCIAWRVEVEDPVHA